MICPICGHRYVSDWSYRIHTAWCERRGETRDFDVTIHPPTKIDCSQTYDMSSYRDWLWKDQGGHLTEQEIANLNGIVKSSPEWLEHYGQ